MVILEIAIESKRIMFGNTQFRATDRGKASIFSDLYIFI